MSVIRNKGIKESILPEIIEEVGDTILSYINEKEDKKIILKGEITCIDARFRVLG